MEASLIRLLQAPIPDSSTTSTCANDVQTVKPPSTMWTPFGTSKLASILNVPVPASVNVATGDKRNLGSTNLSTSATVTYSRLQNNILKIPTVTSMISSDRGLQITTTNKTSSIGNGSTVPQITISNVSSVGVNDRGQQVPANSEANSSNKPTHVFLKEYILKKGPTVEMSNKSTSYRASCSTKSILCKPLTTDEGTQTHISYQKDEKIFAIPVPIPVPVFVPVPVPVDYPLAPFPIPLPFPLIFPFKITEKKHPETVTTASTGKFESVLTQLFNDVSPVSSEDSKLSIVKLHENSIEPTMTVKKENEKAIETRTKNPTILNFASAVIEKRSTESFSREKAIDNAGSPIEEYIFNGGDSNWILCDATSVIDEEAGTSGITSKELRDPIHISTIPTERTRRKSKRIKYTAGHNKKSKLKKVDSDSDSDPEFTCSTSSEGSNWEDDYEPSYVKKKRKLTKQKQYVHSTPHIASMLPVADPPLLLNRSSKTYQKNNNSDSDDITVMT